VRFSHRLDPLPEYLSARLQRRVAERRAAGRDVISLGIGDPDLPPTAAARAALAEAVQRDDVAHYPTNRGLAPLREAVARFYAARFGVVVDPETEVLPLLGAKEGIAHLCLAQLDAGDAALVAEPGYPVYVGGPVLAGAEPIGLPLRPELGFQPDLDAIPAAARERANLLVLGYPNNPTGAVADDDLFDRLVAFSAAHDVPLCHDNAYSEITFDGYVAPSLLAAPGARERGIELLSLSKAFSLPGWRIAFAVGDAAMIANLHRLKTNVDTGMFEALQRAAIGLLDSDPAERRALAATYERRRDLVCDALDAAGIALPRPRGAMYVWMPVPGEEPSLDFAERLFDQVDVVVGPGRAYGPAGEGYVRLALTQPEDRLAEAIARIVSVL
jgi:LL-diaminopimelate aminotransferase